jgi:hypothetical protein
MDPQNLIDFKDGFAAKNKWIADIALSRVSSDLKNITLHLAEFSIPAVNIGSTNTTYKSITQELPTHTLQPTDRNITFSYMIDITWVNYFTLYQWANLLGNIENITPARKLLWDAAVTLDSSDAFVTNAVVQLQPILDAAGVTSTNFLKSCKSDL